MMLLAAMTLMSFSCSEKEEIDDPILPEGITAEELKGDWNFVSLEFNGETYTDCDPVLNANYGYVTLNFWNVTSTQMKLHTDCTDNGVIDNRVYLFTVSNNMIDCEEGSRKFQILNVSTFNGTELKIKFISGSANGFPIGGIYTLEKE